jgi:hypothetical protein
MPPIRGGTASYDFGWGCYVEASLAALQRGKPQRQPPKGGTPNDKAASITLAAFPLNADY